MKTKLKTRPSESLYVHIPFCTSICSYCDFPKIIKSDHFEADYLLALEEELSSIAGRRLKTLYIGGGTPTALEPAHLENLLTFLEQSFDLTSLEEYTVESTIDELTPEKARLLKQYQVTRLSLGVETLKSDIPYLNRHTDKKALKDKVELIKELKFYDFNLDLIYGWPGTEEADLSADLEYILSFDPPHISAYPLAVEQGTRLAMLPLKPLSGDEYASLYEFLIARLKKAGLFRYEVSNFARPGHESRHNLAYWHQDNYLAAGLGAVSYVDGMRVTRTRSLTRYLRRDLIAETEIESFKEQMDNYLMLNLRLDCGFSLHDFKRRFGVDFLQLYKKKIEKVRSDLIIDGERVRVPPNRIYVLDAILVDLLKF